MQSEQKPIPSWSHDAIGFSNPHQFISSPSLQKSGLNDQKAVSNRESSLSSPGPLRLPSSVSSSPPFSSHTQQPQLSSSLVASSLSVSISTIPSSPSPQNIPSSFHYPSSTLSLSPSPLSGKTPFSSPSPSPSPALTLSPDLLHSDVVSLILKRPLSAPTSPISSSSPLLVTLTSSPSTQLCTLTSNGMFSNNHAVAGVSRQSFPLFSTTTQSMSRSIPLSLQQEESRQQSSNSHHDTEYDEEESMSSSSSSSTSSSLSGHAPQRLSPPTRNRRRRMASDTSSPFHLNHSTTTTTTTSPSSPSSSIKNPLNQRDQWRFNEVDPRHSWCEGIGITDHDATSQIVGTVRHFKVHCCNELGMPIVDPTLHVSRETRTSLISVRVEGPQRDPPIQPQIVPMGSGVFTVSYVVLVQGVYEVHVLIKGQHVRGSPFLEIWEASESNRTSALHTTAMGLGLVHAVAGQETAFFIQARDAFNNPRSVGGDPFDVRLRSVKTSTPPVPSPLVKLRDYQNGTYAIVYTVWHADMYFIDVTLHGVAIQGSPFRTEVVPAACSVIHCSVQGSGLRAALVNPWISPPPPPPTTTTTTTNSSTSSVLPSPLPSSFVLTLRDRYGNLRPRNSDRIRLVMESVQLRSKVIDRGVGTYLVEYTVSLQSVTQLQLLAQATRPVRVPLYLFINDEMFPGCPFNVELTLRKMDFDLDRTPTSSSSSSLQQPSLSLSSPETTTSPTKRSLTPPSALVRVQSIIRMHHALVLYAQLRKMYRLRTKAASELLSSEENYVRCLNRLKEEYLNPLRLRAQQGKPIISLARIALIFGNIEFILGLNTELLAKLRTRIQAWSPTQVVGDIMIDAAPSLRHTYTHYVNNYDQALKTMNWCLQKESAFAFFLESKEQASLQQQMSQLVNNQKNPTATSTTKNTQPYLSLPAYLIMPVQRLPKYELLLQELLKYTFKEHRDYNLLQKALQQIKETTNFVNENKRNAENLSKLLSIQNTIHNCISLFNVDRVFLRDETFKVRIGKKSSERHVFLFNDLLLFTRIKKSPKGAAYKYKESVLLQQAIVEKSPALGDHTFKLIVPQVVTYIFVASSREVAERWFRDIQNATKALAQRERQQSTPSIPRLQQS